MGSSPFYEGSRTPPKPRVEPSKMPSQPATPFAEGGPEYLGALSGTLWLHNKLCNAQLMVMLACRAVLPCLAP